MLGRKKVKLSDYEKKQCNTIIPAAAAAADAAGTGLAQIPLADNAVITPIQIGMIIKLGSVFDCSITENVAKGIISGAGAAFIGRGISQALWGWIPFAGNAINTATAAGLTEAIGWMAVKEFSTKQWMYMNDKEAAEEDKDEDTEETSNDTEVEKQSEEDVKKLETETQESDHMKDGFDDVWGD